jgi:hypothetical protein
MERIAVNPEARIAAIITNHFRVFLVGIIPALR